jgi:hypothetical protein
MLDIVSYAWEDNWEASPLDRNSLSPPNLVVESAGFRGLPRSEE